MFPLKIYIPQQEMLEEARSQEKTAGKNPEDGVNAVRGIFASISEYL